MSLVSNHKATFNYDILDKYEAGIELLGLEVKSVRGGNGSLLGSFVKFLGGEAFLVGADIPPYQALNTPPSYDRQRVRKLLMGKKLIRDLGEKVERDGLTIIPISLYNKGAKLKIELALARGKKKSDKRQKVMKRESDREIERTLKTRR